MRAGRRAAGTEISDAHGYTGFLLRGQRFAWLLVDHLGDGRLALCAKAQPDWAEVGGFLAQAWRMTATKTAVTAYDAARSRPG